MRYCFTNGFGVMGDLRVERTVSPARRDDLLRRRAPSATSRKPIHVRAELLALALDLVALALLAHAQEVLLPGAVLRDPLARERAGLDLAQDVLHRLAGRVRDDPLAAGEVAVFRRVRDRVVHPGDALLVDQVHDELELVEALEVRQARVVAGIDQRLVAGADQ